MKKVTANILSILYTISIVVGVSFLVKGNFSLLTKSFFNVIISILFSIILFLFFKRLIILLTKYIDHYKQKTPKAKNKLLILFDEHPIIFSIVFLLLCWLPYIIAFYPGIINKDNIFQIKQFFGIDNKYSYFVNLIDKNQIITNHHPFFHTILLGSCTKIGMSLHNTNFGFFLYTMLQVTVFILTLSYTIYYLKKNNINYRYRLFILLIYAFVPHFPFYAITLVKDSMYSCFFILYIILLHSIIKNDLDLKKSIQIVIISILLFLFRNNGIYTFILSFSFLLIKNKKWPKYLVVLLIVFGSYKVYDNVILPSLKVTPTSVRETLSIPFQQTARYVKYHGNEYNLKDKKIINNILDYDIIKKKYNPELSDPVKNTFNKDYTKKDIHEYFKVWYKGLIKHPITYIEATIENTYGYFCPIKTNWYLYYKYQDRLLKEDNIDYHYNNLNKLRDIEILYGTSFPYIPVIGLIANIGINTWVIFFLLYYLYVSKRYKEIIYLLPCIVSILVCIASPANTYFRYVLPYVMSIPLLILLIFNKNNQKIQKG